MVLGILCLKTLLVLQNFYNIHLKCNIFGTDSLWWLLQLNLSDNVKTRDMADNEDAAYTIDATDTIDNKDSRDTSH